MCAWARVHPGAHKRYSCAPGSTKKGHLCRIAIEMILSVCLYVPMCVYACGYESVNPDFGLSPLKTLVYAFTQTLSPKPSRLWSMP